LRPTAFIVIHPTKSSIVEALMFARRLPVPVDITALQSSLHTLNKLGLFGKDFAETYANFWSKVVGCPSWRKRNKLDAFPALTELAVQCSQWVDHAIHNEESLCLMADPHMCYRLLEAGYDLLFIESDTSLMSNPEMKVCYPRDFDGVCGGWLKAGLPRNAIGKIHVTTAICA